MNVVDIIGFPSYSGTMENIQRFYMVELQSEILPGGVTAMSLSSVLYIWHFLIGYRSRKCKAI